jgi:hypothetical protein
MTTGPDHEVKTMETRKLVMKALLLSAAYPGAFCAVLILVISLIGRLTPKSIFWLGAGLAIMYAPIMGSLLAKGLIAVATHPKPIALDPETIELRKRSRSQLQKMRVLSTLAVIFAVAATVVIVKYESISVGLSLAGVGFIFSLLNLRVSRRLRSLHKSAKASSPAPAEPTHKRSDKGRFYAICMALMCLSVIPAVVLPASVYYFVTGTQTTLVYYVAAAAIAALASIPFFSGLIVKKLGLPESIEIS